MGFYNYLLSNQLLDQSQVSVKRLDRADNIYLSIFKKKMKWKRTWFICQNLRAKDSRLNPLVREDASCKLMSWLFLPQAEFSNFCNMNAN